MEEQIKYKCPGFEIETSIFSGCDPSRNDDCPVCEGTGYIQNCPVCGEPVKSDGTCRNGCWFPLELYN